MTAVEKAQSADDGNGDGDDDMEDMELECPLRTQRQRPKKQSNGMSRRTWDENLTT